MADILLRDRDGIRPEELRDRVFKDVIGIELEKLKERFLSDCDEIEREKLRDEVFKYYYGIESEDLRDRVVRENDLDNGIRLEECKLLIGERDALPRMMPEDREFHVSDESQSFDELRGIVSNKYRITSEMTFDELSANEVLVPHDDDVPYPAKPLKNEKVVPATTAIDVSLNDNVPSAIDVSALAVDVNVNNAVPHAIDVNAIAPVPSLIVTDEQADRVMPYFGNLEKESNLPLTLCSHNVVDINASELNMPIDMDSQEILSILRMVPEPFQNQELECCDTKVLLERFGVPFEVEMKRGTSGSNKTIDASSVDSSQIHSIHSGVSCKDYSLSLDHVVPENESCYSELNNTGDHPLAPGTPLQQRNHAIDASLIEVELLASDHERFLLEMSEGNVQCLFHSEDKACSCTQGVIQTQCELHEHRDVERARDCYVDRSNSYVPRSHYEKSREELSRSNDLLSGTYSTHVAVVTESRDHLDQLMTKLMNKSYDEINVKLEDDANILIVEVKETTVLDDEEMTLLEQCDRRRSNYARSKSLDDAVAKVKLRSANSCDQLLLCNRNTSTATVKKVDLLVSHFTMCRIDQVSKETVLPMKSSRSQNFTQSLNTILGGKQTKSVSFALQIDNIETPQRTKKSRSGSKKTKSCCID